MSLKELYQETSDNVLNVVYLNRKVFMSDIECQYQGICYIKSTAGTFFIKLLLLRRMKIKLREKKLKDYT